MTKILFIMFQGIGTNLKTWNEKTESKFLDRLKDLGSVYTYQDKTNNISYYDKTETKYKDYDPDIDIDLSYVNPEKHIKMVYDDIKIKYKNSDEYKFIPIGWSIGCLLALYFAQLYSSQCIHVILLDPTVFTPNNIKKKLEVTNNGLYPITNAKYKKMLLKWKEHNEEFENVWTLKYLHLYIRLLFFSKHLKLELSVPTLTFFNIVKPATKENDLDRNKEILEEIKILKKYNPEKYKAIKFFNKSHYIFNMIQPAKEIIKQIKNIIIKSAF